MSPVFFNFLRPQSRFHKVFRALLAILALGGGFPAGKLWAQEHQALKVGVFVDDASLPLVVAQEKGYFRKAGVEVQLLRFKSAVERDAALQAGALDGAISDILSLVLSNQAGFALRATSSTNGRFGLVLSPKSAKSSIGELAGVPVGVSSKTIIQYVSDSLESRAGIPAAQIRSLAVPNMMLRMELLASGQLEAACLPDPLFSVAVARGGRLLATSDKAGIEADIIVFTKAALDSRLSDIAAFYHAYDDAAAELNAHPDAFRGFIIDKAGFPAEARDSFSFPRYQPATLPKVQDVDSVVAWLKAQAVLPSTATIASADLLDGRPLPLAGAR